jgi:hypothetical protein
MIRCECVETTEETHPPACRPSATGTPIGARHARGQLHGRDKGGRAQVRSLGNQVGSGGGRSATPSNTGHGSQ